MASNIRFISPAVQCGTTSIAWDGGVEPLRLEIYQQTTPTSGWNGTGLIYDVFGAEHTVDWQVSVAQGTRLWATIVDHTGVYNQSLSPAVVEAGSDNSCLLQVVKTSDVNASTRQRVVFVGAILGSLLFVALLLVALLAFLLRRSRDQLRHRRDTLSDRPRLVLDTASTINDDTATISSRYSTDGRIAPATATTHSRHTSYLSPPTSSYGHGGPEMIARTAEDPFADPIGGGGGRKPAPSISSSTGTAREHVEMSSGPLRVRNTMDSDA